MSNNMIRKVEMVVILGSMFISMGCTSPDSNKQNAQANGQLHSQKVESNRNMNTATAAPKTSEPAASIPEFKFYKLKSGFRYEKSDIPAGRNTVFILFDPSCRYCQIEAGELAKNYNKLKDVNLLFVSMNDPALMDKFLASFAPALEGKENVELLYDREQQFIRQFHIPLQFPANYVYGPDGKLKTYWSGEKKIQDVLAAFTN